MTELVLLRLLVLVSVAVAPLSRRLLGPPPRGWSVAHALGIGLVAAALVGPLPQLAYGWLVFCVGGALMFAVEHGAALRTASRRTATTFAAGVPLAFGVIAATWIAGATNDLRILGYGPHFSFYAALHGNVLGWTLLGGVAALAQRAGRFQRVHLATVFLGFASFLLVALGIDRLAWLKPLGVLGLTLALPLSMLAFLIDARGNRAAFALGALAFGALVLTLALAWLNELGSLSVEPLGGIRAMVWLHGLVNGLVVGPAWLGAVATSGLATRPPETP